MSILNKFYKKDILIQKTIEIDCVLFDKIDFLSKEVYDASISKLINACIDELIEKENISLYEKNENEISLKHTIILRNSSLEGLEKLKQKYDISINKLINISIHNVLKEDNII